MLRRLLIVILATSLAACATPSPEPVVQFIDKPKLNLGTVDKPDLDLTGTEWTLVNDSTVETSKEGFDIFLDNLTKILDYQLKLEEQLESIKKYYKEE